MTRRSSDPIASLTIGELRAELRAAIERHAPDSGSEADAEASGIRFEVEMLRRELDELGDYLEEHIGFAYDVYEWWQAGMPKTGPTVVRLQEQATRKALRLDSFARGVNECRESDGTLPTQEVAAEHLGVTSRTLRNAPWSAILRRARELAGEAEPPE